MLAFEQEEENCGKEQKNRKNKKRKE